MTKLYFAMGVAFAITIFGFWMEMIYPPLCAYEYFEHRVAVMMQLFGFLLTIIFVCWWGIKKIEDVNHHPTS